MAMTGMSEVHSWPPEITFILTTQVNPSSEPFRFSVEGIIKLKYLFAWNFFFPGVDSWLRKWFECVTGKLGPASISLSSPGLQHEKLLVSIFNRIVHRSDYGNRSRTFTFEASVLGPANQDIYSHPIPNRSQFIPTKIPILGKLD